MLSKIAQHVVIIHISTVAFGSAFNTDNHILDQFQSSLSPATIEALFLSKLVASWTNQH
jgi:hypothetical protein